MSELKGYFGDFDKIATRLLSCPALLPDSKSIMPCLEHPMVRLGNAL